MKQLKTLFALVAATAILGGCEHMNEPAKPAEAAKPAAAPAAAADPALAAKVSAALKADQYVKQFNFTTAATTDGAVTVSGKVRNDFQVYQAGAAAKAVPGVKSVSNKVTLDE